VRFASTSIGAAAKAGAIFSFDRLPRGSDSGLLLEAILDLVNALTGSGGGKLGLAMARTVSLGAIGFAAAGALACFADSLAIVFLNLHPILAAVSCLGLRN
jgi:hypothetical protein